jgi:hypothetical protein
MTSIRGPEENELARLVKEVLGSASATAFDPNPIRFTVADERGLAPVRRACNAVDGRLQSLRAPINRNAFLYGSLDFTETETIEHLIVGFSSRSGSTAKVAEVAHVVGGRAQVTIPDWLRSAVDSWMSSHHRAEAIVFHNHPPNILNILFDNAPLPSSTDRQTLLGYYLKPLVALKGLSRGGRVRFFLGENGFVREFRSPDLVGIARTRG